MNHCNSAIGCDPKYCPPAVQPAISGHSIIHPCPASCQPCYRMASVSAIESEQGGQHAVSGEFKHRAVAVDWAGYRRTSNPGDTVKAAVISWRQTCRTSAVGTVEGIQSRQLSCRCQLKNPAIIVETIGNVIARGGAI